MKSWETWAYAGQGLAASFGLGFAVSFEEVSITRNVLLKYGGKLLGVGRVMRVSLPSNRRGLEIEKRSDALPDRRAG